MFNQASCAAMVRAMAVHLVKLAVGIDSVPHLHERQKQRIADRQAAGEGESLRILTRNTPRRGDELLAGEGSIYWVIKGRIQARQRILGFEEASAGDGTPGCAIVLGAGSGAAPALAPLPGVALSPRTADAPGSRRRGGRAPARHGRGTARARSDLTADRTILRAGMRENLANGYHYYYIEGPKRRGPMYVCVCNAIREDEVAAAISQGVRSVDDVYERLDVEPQCRSCEGCIETMMALVPVAAGRDAA